MHPGTAHRHAGRQSVTLTNECNLLRKCLYEQSHGEIRGRRKEKGEKKEKGRFTLGHQLAADGLAKPISFTTLHLSQNTDRKSNTLLGEGEHTPTHTLTHTHSHTDGHLHLAESP